MFPSLGRWDWLWRRAGEDAPVSQGRWGFLAGYGMTHPGMGKTKIWVETVDLIPRYERELIDDLGSSWYRGRPSLLVELPIHLVVDRRSPRCSGSMSCPAGILPSRGPCSPTFLVGADWFTPMPRSRGWGGRLNANYQLGGGLRYRISGERYLSIEYRLHHMSNGDTKDPNCPFSSSKLLIGMIF